MQPGDVIVSLSSTGVARWETTANSGIGSNGLTSARHDGLTSDYRRYSETYAPEVDVDLIYNGQHKLTDPYRGRIDDRWRGVIIANANVFAVYQAAIDHIPAASIHGIIHCSGGGQAKIGKFGAVPDGRAAEGARLESV